MSNIQKILYSIAEEIDNNTVTASDIRRICRCLDALHTVYHEQVALAAFGESFGAEEVANDAE